VQHPVPFGANTHPDFIQMKKIAFLLVMSLCCATLFAQPVNTDSLWQVWNDTTQPDTARMKAIQTIAWSLLYRKPDSTYLLAEKELRFALQVNNKKWQAKALNVIGSTYNIRGEYARALASYQKGLAAMQEAGDLRGIAAISNNIGLIYRNLGNGVKALEFYEKDLAIQEQLHDKGGIANANNNIGLLYNDLGNLPKALEYYRKSLEQHEALGEKYGTALAYNNVGSVYNSQGEFTKALEYYGKSIRLRKELDDQQGLSKVYGNIGQLYKEQGQYNKALEYYQLSLAIQEKMDEQPGLIDSYYNLGVLAQNEKNYHKAIDWCQKSLQLARRLESLRPQRNACDCLYESHKALGHVAAALSFHEQFGNLNDSLQKEEVNRRLEQMEFVRQVMADSLGNEEEKLKIEVVHQNEVRSKNRTLNIVLVAGLVLLALALAFWGRMLYFRKNSQIFQNKAEYLEKQRLLNEIALLKTQVNPHFLFNSLSILSSLVHVNPDLSEQFIDQLSRSYRYILEQKEQSLVSLRTELEFIRSYFFLLKIRFENKFDLQAQLPEEALDRYKIAPMTLQLLIENAVKHNRMSLKEPLVIEISIEGDFLLVKNRLQLRPQREASTGTGLANIINRYALLTDRAVRAGECEDAFLVKIPLLDN